MEPQSVKQPDKRSAGMRRWATTLLRLYPPAWRARYQDELAAVLEQHTSTLATIVDLLRGALDARLDPAFTGERIFRPMSRLRASAVALCCAYAAFTLGYGAFQRLADPAAPFGQDDRSALTMPSMPIATWSSGASIASRCGVDWQRYEKCAVNYRAMLVLASIDLWLEG